MRPYRLSGMLAHLLIWCMMVFLRCSWFGCCSCAVPVVRGGRGARPCAAGGRRRVGVAEEPRSHFLPARGAGCRGRPPMGGGGGGGGASTVTSKLGGGPQPDEGGGRGVGGLLRAALACGLRSGRDAPESVRLMAGAGGGGGGGRGGGGGGGGGGAARGGGGGGGAPPAGWGGGGGDAGATMARRGASL